MRIRLGLVLFQISVLFASSLLCGVLYLFNFFLIKRSVLINLSFAWIVFQSTLLSHGDLSRVGQKHVNPFAGAACKSAHIHDGKLYFMDLLPVLCILIEIAVRYSSAKGLCILVKALSHPHAQGEKSLINSNLALFLIVRFPSDGPACSAVKGLN